MTSKLRSAMAFLLTSAILPFFIPYCQLVVACGRCNVTVMATPIRLEHDSVVPDVIDVSPNETIRIKYPSGAEVNLGNELTPTQVKDEPSDIYWLHDGTNETLYTLAMVDPDAPSRANPTVGQVLHWLVVNIQFNRIANGKTMAGYRGSGPPEGTGLHRYIFLVYKQPERLEPEEAVISKTSRNGRLNFKIRDYAKKYNLGEPIAANYYQAQYDDYVPILKAMTTD